MIFLPDEPNGPYREERFSDNFVPLSSLSEEKHSHLKAKFEALT
jgi:hypothetical protein